MADEFRALTVADLMAAPVTLSDGTSVRDAAMFLARSGASVIPVVSSEGEYAGAVGEIDIHQRLSQGTRGFHSAEEFRTGVPFLGARLPDAVWLEFARVGWTPVRDVARQIPPVAPRRRAVEAFEVMRRLGLSAIPVVADDRPVGILHADALTLKLLEFVLAAER